VKVSINVAGFIFITTVILALGVLPGVAAAVGIVVGYAWRVVDEAT
jgi:uncharacterized membrane protein